MNGLLFGQLSAYAPRRFVPAEINLGDWVQIEPLFDLLEDRAGRCSTPAALEQWLLDGGEINAALEEEGTRRYIAMTCQTADPAYEAAYLHFIEAIEPKLKPRRVRLARLYLEHPQRGGLPPSRYAVFERNTRLLIELFRPENVPLETEEAKLGQQYQKLSGSLAVSFHGEERTLPQMGRFLEEPDRALRQAAWEAVAHRRLQEAERQRQLFTAQPVGGRSGGGDAVAGPASTLPRLRPWDLAVELLGADYLEAFYDAASARRAWRAHLEAIVTLFPWVATVDAFQHWLYTHPGHERVERRAAWLSLMDQFGGEVDWSGYVEARALLWHRQLHLFLHPLYYIEYGIAQLAALQIWVHARQDRAQTLRHYRTALALGGSRPLPELFAAAGCRFDFTAQTLRPLIEQVRAACAALGDEPSSSDSMGLEPSRWPKCRG